MAKYAIFFRFTGESTKAMMDNPSDRESAVRTLCQSAGGTLEAYYWMFGDWDGFVIADLPDSATAAALSLAVSSSGAFSQLQTHELLTSGDIAGAVSAATRLTYQPPGRQ